MSQYSAYNFLRVEVSDRVATVTLNKPERNNTFDAEGHREMAAIWNALDADDAVRAVIITSAGEGFFCGGPAPEFLELLSTPTEGALRDRAFKEALQVVHGGIEFDKPVITAMNGIAHGGGLAFALMADIIIMERQVTIQDGHVFVGVTAGDGGTLIWPLAMGLTRAKRYLLTGDPLSADEAQSLGLVTEVVERGRSLARARQYAARFAAGPQAALRSTKRSLNQWLRAGSITAFHSAWAQEVYTMSTADIAGSAAGVQRGDLGLMPADPATRSGNPFDVPALKS